MSSAWSFLWWAELRIGYMVLGYLIGTGWTRRQKRKRDETYQAHVRQLAREYAEHHGG